MGVQSDSVLKFRKMGSVFLGDGFVLVTAPSVFDITDTSTLTQQSRTALLFLEIKLKTFDNVVFALNKSRLL